MYNMNLKNLYGTFLKNGNSPEAFIANVIYERYGANARKCYKGFTTLSTAVQNITGRPVM